MNPTDMEGDPAKRMERVLRDDMLRLEIYDRVNFLATQYRTEYNCSPSWVRISFDLVYKNNYPLYVEPGTVCGLQFRLALEQHDFIEVGSSVYSQKNENQTQVAQG